MTFNDYNSDTARIIKKFDIYMCDLGEMENISGGNIGKVRPCVIISSDSINNPKANKYVIAPIRTEHNVEIHRGNIERFVRDKAKIDRYYVPLEFTPNDFRFIDISEQRKIPSAKIMNYKVTIINPEVRRRINNTLAYTLFSEDELKDIDYSEFANLNNVEDSGYNIVYEDANDEMIESQNYKQLEVVEDHELDNDIISKEIETARSEKMKNLPTGFSLYYTAFRDKKMTVKEISKRLGKSTGTIYNYIKLYKQVDSEFA